jgi:hypothetical protein
MADRGSDNAREFPPGFCGWPLDRKNAWHCGYYRGYLDRLARDVE